MKFRWMLLLIIFVFYVKSGLLAQPGLILETSGGYANNVFHNYKALPDYYTDVDAYVHYDWINTKFGLRTFYNGTLTSFDLYKDKNYQNHSLGISWYRLLNEKGNRINAGTSVTKRMHSEAYHWFELQTASFYLNSKLVLNNQLFSYFGVNLASRSYESLPAFSHWQADLFARLSKFFATGTTVILEGDIMHKTYYPADETNTTVDFPDIITQGDGKSISSVLMLRLAQGITPKTGLSSQVLLRRNSSPSIRYLGNKDGYYYSDEEMFDDIFGYDEEKLELGLTRILPWKSKLAVQYSIQWKKYDTRLALDLEGNALPGEPMRSDTRGMIDISWQKTIRFSKAVDPLAISISWSTVDNKSNDPYYDYKGGYLFFNMSQSL